MRLYANLLAITVALVAVSLAEADNLRSLGPKLKAGQTSISLSQKSVNGGPAGAMAAASGGSAMAATSTTGSFSGNGATSTMAAAAAVTSSPHSYRAAPRKLAPRQRPVYRYQEPVYESDDEQDYEPAYEPPVKQFRNFGRQPRHGRVSAQASAYAGGYVQRPEPAYEEPLYEAPIPAPRRQRMARIPVAPRRAPIRSRSREPAVARAAAATAAVVGRNGGRVAASSMAGVSTGNRYRQPHKWEPEPELEQEPELDYDQYDEMVETDSEHAYEESPSQVHYVATGGYDDDGRGSEKASYQREAEDYALHEDGHIDDDHYYQAQSYGKARDEHEHEHYNDYDDDEIIMPNMYRKRKSGTTYKKESNKKASETGSALLAKDKHSAGYNKDVRHMKERVDQRQQKDGQSYNVNTDFDYEDDDEGYYNNDGVHAAATASVSSVGPARRRG